MRRRSGAIHSDNYQQYLQLSQISQISIGIFYDEKKNRSNTKNMKKIKKIQNDKNIQLNFTSFQFNRTGLAAIQQQNIVDKKITTTSLMIIFKQNEFISERIRSAFQIQQEKGDDFQNPSFVDKKEKNIDLLIGKIQKNQQDIIFKIWLNFQPNLSIFQAYYKNIQNFFLIQDGSYIMDVQGIKQNIKKIRNLNSYNFEVLNMRKDNIFLYFQKIYKSQLEKKSMLNYSVFNNV